MNKRNESNLTSRFSNSSVGNNVVDDYSETMQSLAKGGSPFGSTIVVNEELATTPDVKKTA